MSEQEQAKPEEAQTEKPDSNAECCGINKEMCQDVLQSVQKIDYQGLFARVLLLISRPQEAWGVIKNEKLAIKEIYIQHLVVLMAASSVFTFISSSIIGFSTPIGVFRQGFISGLFYMVLSFVVAIVLVYASGLLLEFIGKLEFFGSKADSISFFKLVAYSMIPGLLGGVVQVLPLVGLPLLFALALYGTYIMSLGVEPMTGIKNKAVYLLSAVVAISVIYAVLFGLIGLLMPQPILG